MKDLGTCNHHLLSVYSNICIDIRSEEAGAEAKKAGALDEECAQVF